MNNVMIDLETLATTPDAAIISIGACYFDPNTGEIGEQFHEVMQWGSIFSEQSVHLNRSIDHETLKWWMQQSDSARLNILEGAAVLDEALCRLHRFIEEGAKVWGNGPTFDISILENAYSQYSMPIPWKFWNVRDVRTVLEIAKAASYNWKENNPREGTHHNALDDAIYQAQYVSDIWQKCIKFNDS